MRSCASTAVFVFVGTLLVTVYYWNAEDDSRSDTFLGSAPSRILTGEQATARLVVVGAGGVGTRVNGKYEKIGTYSGRPKFRKVGGRAIIYYEQNWKINDNDDTSGWYYQAPTGQENDNLPPAGRWRIDGYELNDAKPPPSVCWEQKGTIAECNFPENSTKTVASVPALATASMAAYTPAPPLTLTLATPAPTPAFSTIVQTTPALGTTPAPSIISQESSFSFNDSDGDVIKVTCENGDLNEYCNGVIIDLGLMYFAIDTNAGTYRDPGGVGHVRPGEDLGALMKKRDHVVSMCATPAITASKLIPASSTPASTPALAAPNLTPASSTNGENYFSFTDTDGDEIKVIYENGKMNEYANGFIVARGLLFFKIDAESRTYQDLGGVGHFRPDEDLEALNEKRQYVVSTLAGVDEGNAASFQSL